MTKVLNYMLNAFIIYVIYIFAYRTALPQLTIVWDAISSGFLLSNPMRTTYAVLKLLFIASLIFFMFIVIKDNTKKTSE